MEHTQHLAGLPPGRRVLFRGDDLTNSRTAMLRFVLSAYTLNGTWLGYQQWNKQFQLCGMRKWESSKWQK